MPELRRLTPEQEKALTEVAASLLVDERRVAELVALGLIRRGADGIPRLTRLGFRRFLDIVDAQDA
jgi:hypothetical protein